MRTAMALLLLLALALPALGADAPSYTLEIGEHAFSPAALAVPAGTRVRLLVRNARTLPAEFESFDLNREKVVPPGRTVTVWVGPLSAGEYEFFDDFNPGPTGRIVAAASEGIRP